MNSFFIFEIAEKQNLLCAIGLDESGNYEVLDFGLYPNEYRESWEHFLK